MHREFDSTESPFRPRGNGTHYFLTAALALLLIGDLWPQLAKWLSESVYPTPTCATTEIFGFRFAMIVAVLGGARVLYGSLERSRRAARQDRAVCSGEQANKRYTDPPGTPVGRGAEPCRSPPESKRTRSRR